jgi:Tfp pilus assembly protein PilN
MRAVNLLPRDEQKARSEGRRAPLLVLAGGLGAVTVAAVMLGVSASSGTSDKRAELERVQAAIARLPKPAQPEVSTGALTQERTDRIVALSAALSNRIAFDRLLRQIALVLPEDAWLTGLSATTPETPAPTPSSPGAPSPQPAAAADGVTIQGATYSHSSVARVLSRLAVLPSLQNVRLSASTIGEEPSTDAQSAEGTAKQNKKKGQTLVIFTATASVRSGASS